MKLLTTQKNNLFDLISQSHLLPTNFGYSEDLDRFAVWVNDSVTIRYIKNPDFRFVIAKGSGYPHPFHAFYSPSKLLYSEEQACQSWPEVTKLFSIWIKSLELEETSEDKWESLKTITDSFNISLPSINAVNGIEPFSKEQQIEIRRRISLLQNQINQSEIPKDQAALINERLDHLAGLTAKLSKFDWPAQFVGAMVSIVIQLSVSPQNANHLWALIRQFFSGIVFLH